jgi:hypothetical protein
VQGGEITQSELAVRTLPPTFYSKLVEPPSFQEEINIPDFGDFVNPPPKHEAEQG